MLSFVSLISYQQIFQTMNRNELLKSVDYWTQMLQIDVFELVNKYLKENKMTKTQFAEQLGVSKGYISQIFNGDYDHKLSKLVELSLACGYVPSLRFAAVESAEEVAMNYQTFNDNNINKVSYTTAQFVPLRKFDASGIIDKQGKFVA